MPSTEDIGTRKLAAIMFTDIRDFSRKMGENEVAAMDLLKVHDTMVRDVVAKYGGTVIKSLGDSFMVDFSSAVNAVKCAIEAQERFWHYNQEKADFEKLEIRVGIHLGDVITVGNDIYGDGVNIAARIEAITEPTRICVSADIYNQIKNKLPVRAFGIGSIELKNIAEPVEVFELLVDSIPELSVPSQSARRAPAHRKAESISRQEEEEAKQVEATKQKVDGEKQREESEKQERARVHFVRAEEFFRVGDFAKAEEAIKEVYRIVDIHYDAQMLLLRLEEERTRKEEEDRRQRVIVEKKRKEEERKQRIHDCIQRAIQHVEQDQYTEALAAVQDVYRVDPNNEHAKQLEEQIRQADQARAELKRLQYVEEQEKTLQEHQLREQQEAEEALARAKAAIAESHIGFEGIPKAKRILYGAVAGGTVVVLAVATLLMLHLFSKPASIVVLTFTSNSAQDAHIAEALSTFVTEEISRNEGVLVISPSSARTIDPRNTDLREVGRTFGVRYALVGSVQANPQMVALTARLIEIDSQEPLWESTVESDLFGLNDLAVKVSTGIHTALDMQAPPERTQRSTSNTEAYDLYLRGRQLVCQQSLISIEQGLTMLRQAVQLDSTFGLAYAAFAEGELQLFKRGGERDRTRLNEALRASRIALSMNASIAAAYQTLGEVYRYTQQFDNAWQAIDKSLSLQPGSAECYRQLALLALIDGDREGAKEYATTALQIDPKHYDSHVVEGLIYLYGKEYQAASQSFESASSLGADDSLLTVDYKFKAWVGLDQGKKIVEYSQGLLERADDPAKVIVYYWIGRGYQLEGEIESLGIFDQGIELAEKVVTQNPNDAITWAYYALLQARRAKNPEMATKAIETADNIAPNAAQLQYLKARLYALRKDNKKAIASLAKAVSTEFKFSEIFDPDFLSIKNDPEFASTIARKGGSGTSDQ